ncbi:MAG: hypothetical protein ABL949_13000 [Fimbriimonadaceae bacterium]
MWKFGVIGLALGLFIVGGCQGNRYVMENGKVIDTQTGKEVQTEVKMPEPDAWTNPDYTALDITPYPNSKPTVKKFQLVGIDTPDGLQFTATWKTKDPVQKIVDHFRPQIPTDKIDGVGGGQTILGKTSKGYNATVFIKAEGKETLISVIVTQPKTLRLDN